MRISDWSSDVCSSDLGVRARRVHGLVPVEGGPEPTPPVGHGPHVGGVRRQLGRRHERVDRHLAGAGAGLGAMEPTILKLASSESTAWCLPSSRSEEHTSELQSLMRISYAVFCLKKKTKP